MTEGSTRRPLRVLVVASWYPAVDDAAAGRFVADQVAALESTGEAAVEVVSYDHVRLVGGATARARQVDAVHAAIATAIASEPEPFVRVGEGVGRPGRVARLAVVAGTTPVLGTTSAATHRAATLDALADRLLADRATSPDLIHAHTGYPDGAAAAVLADRLDRPLVITEHATFLDRILDEPQQRARYAVAGQRASRIVAVSSVLADQIRTALPSLADRVVVVPNSVAVEEFRIAIPADRVADELLYVGYRKEIKGIDTLLEAFAIVRAARPGARLRLIGRSPSDDIERRWHLKAASLGLTDSVSFEDVLDRAGIAAAMARASVFVHASRYETFGVVVAEALAAGLPVVATDSGGVGEILRPDPEAVGALVAVDEAGALGEAVIRTLERRASFDPVALRASVVGRFGSRVVADTLISLYRDVIAEAAGRSDGGAGESGVAPARDALVGNAPSSEPPAGARPMGAPSVVVVGLDRRAAAESLARLPEDLLAGLSVVTARQPRSSRLPRVGRIVEVAVPPIPAAIPRPPATGIATLDRLIRLARDPIGTVRRRTGGSTLGAGAIGAAAKLVAAALDELSGTTGSGEGAERAARAARPDDPAASGARECEIVALDGRDVLVASRLIAPGRIRLSPGGLRRLADVWRASHGIDPP